MSGVGGPAITGGDWPNPLPAVTPHKKPRPLPTGLDWDAHRSPDPQPPATVPATKARALDAQTEAHEEQRQRFEAIESREPKTKRRGPARKRATGKPRERSGRVRIEEEQPGLVDKVRRAYVDELRSQEAIAADLGLAPNTVSRILRRNGIPARPRGIAGRTTVVRTQDRLKELGVTSAEVRTWARMKGIPTTRRGVLSTALVDAYVKDHQ